jgi:hypothetical protein
MVRTFMMTARLWCIIEKKGFLGHGIPDSRPIDTGLQLSMPVAGQMVFCSHHHPSLCRDRQNDGSSNDHEELVQFAATARSSNDYECSFCCTYHCASADPDAIQV